MRAAFAILSVAIIACAWGAHRLIRPDAPVVVFTDCRRERDPGFSEHEQALVGAARRHLERREHLAIDAYTTVSDTRSTETKLLSCMFPVTTMVPSRCSAIIACFSAALDR